MGEASAACEPGRPRPAPSSRISLTCSGEKNRKEESSVVVSQGSAMEATTLVDSGEGDKAHSPVRSDVSRFCRRGGALPGMAHGFFVDQSRNHLAADWHSRVLGRAARARGCDNAFGRKEAANYRQIWSELRPAVKPSSKEAAKSRLDGAVETKSNTLPASTLAVIATTPGALKTGGLRGSCCRKTIPIERIPGLSLKETQRAVVRTASEQAKRQENCSPAVAFGKAPAPARDI